MLKGCAEVSAHYQSQRMTEKEAENRVTLDDVRAKYDELLARLKREPTGQNYVNVLALGLMSGLFCPPRRNEWAMVKVRDFDKATDNWLDARKMQVTFNQYKTSSKYGPQVVKIPPEIVPILRKWLKMNDTQWLFVDARGGPLESWGLSKRLRSIFDGKSVTANQLRSLFVSRDASELNRLQKEADEMGHSLETHITYIRQS
jgi:integrase